MFIALTAGHGQKLSNVMLVVRQKNTVFGVKESNEGSVLRVSRILDYFAHLLGLFGN